MGGETDVWCRIELVNHKHKAEDVAVADCALESSSRRYVEDVTGRCRIDFWSPIRGAKLGSYDEGVIDNHFAGAELEPLEKSICKDRTLQPQFDAIDLPHCNLASIEIPIP